MRILLSISVMLLLGLAGCTVANVGTEPSDGQQTAAAAGNGGKTPQNIEKKITTKMVTTGPDAFELDNTPGTAMVISVNTASQERNFYDNYLDWLKFDAVAGRRYTIESWVYGAADTVLSIHSSSDFVNSLAYNDDKGDGTYGSQLSWNCPATGTYYIKNLSWWSNIGVNRGYEIIVLDNTVARDGYEEDDTKIKANIISSDGVNQAHDFADDNTDWVRVYMIKGYHYTLESVVSGSADTVFSLYTETNDVVLAYNDDKGNGTYGSKVEYTAPASGYYYLKIASYAGAFGPDRAYTVNIKRSAKPYKKWTMMVYLDADNNLDPFGVADLNEMKAVATSADLDIIVLWDDTGTNHGYYKVTQNTVTRLVDLGEVNMGNLATVTNFINYVVANYPSDHYFLDFWNHGGGPDRSGVMKGVCWDDANGGDYLTEVEQRAIMVHFTNRIGKKVDIVGFDACLMGSAEIAYQYYGLAENMVASEDLIPGNGWDYNFLREVVTNPEITASALANQVVNYYRGYYANSSSVTLSSYNLAYAGNLRYYLNDFCVAATNSGVAPATFRSLMTTTLGFNGATTRDLSGYMTAITNSAAIPATLKTKAVNVKNAITALCQSEWHSANYQSRAFGLSIVMKADTVVYRQLQLSIDSSWNEFCTFAGF